MEKGDREKENSKDRISELPDATLFIILSFLTIKEVANICFLSKRLKDLLPHIVSFNFDASPTLTQLRKNGNLRKNKRSWYINWVNHRLPDCLIGSLNSLCLRFVKVSGQVLEHFLMHCPLLEKLVVEWSKSLVSLKVASSSPLRLQYLEIRSCLSLQNLEISAHPILRTFLYYGQKMALYIEDAPVLANVLIGGNLDDEPAFAFCPLSSYLCQLETLTLEMSAYNMNLKIWRSATYNHHAHSSSSATGKPIHSLKEIEVTALEVSKSMWISLHIYSSMEE
ncbi:hypothetical protein GQ457_03G010330 [Hibiscus cannabinus]